MSRHWAATVVMLGQLGAADVERQRRDVSSSEVKTLARRISKIAVLLAVTESISRTLRRRKTLRSSGCN